MTAEKKSPEKAWAKEEAAFLKELKEKNLKWVETETLKAEPGRARKHSGPKIARLAETMKYTGFLQPLVIDANNKVVCGAARLAAATRIGWPRVPVIMVDDMSTEQRKMLEIADNQFAILGVWDDAKLATDFKLFEDSGVDLALTGFSTPEVDMIMAMRGPANVESQVSVPDVLPISAPGDRWSLGRHRLLCGSALEASCFQKLLDNERATMVFTDPPYNVPILGHVSGMGAVSHREFVMGSGEMSREQFSEFLQSSMVLMARYTANGGLIYCFMDWRHIEQLLEANRLAGLTLVNLCVWVKPQGGMGSFYRSRHELVSVARVGKQHQNNVELGRHGRNRTNVWEYDPPFAPFGRATDEGRLLELHPTVKPTQLVADAILDCTARGDLVLDPFAGSGSTLMAAERTGRRCAMIEADPLYVDTIIRRWQETTGDEAVDEAGRSFNERELATKGE